MGPRKGSSSSAPTQAPSQSPAAVSEASIKSVNKRILKELEKKEVLLSTCATLSKNPSKEGDLTKLTTPQVGQPSVYKALPAASTHVCVEISREESAPITEPALVEQAPNVDPAPAMKVNGSGAQLSKPTLSFRDVVAGNRNPANGRSLTFTFIEGIADGIVNFTPEDVQDEIIYWSCSLVGVVLGTRIRWSAMHSYISSAWSSIEVPKITRLENSVFLFRFSSIQNLKLVMEGGPSLVGGKKPLILKQWRKGLKLDPSSFDTTPLWINLPALDLQFWGDHMLSKIGSAIGRPISIDKMTALKEKLSYARLLIEVSATDELRQEITLGGRDGEIYQQSIEYEWIPAKLTLAKCWGTL